jgi:hypothetical protein
MNSPDSLLLRPHSTVAAASLSPSQGQSARSSSNASGATDPALGDSSIYRVIRPWLTSTFDELSVYC